MNILVLILLSGFSYLAMADIQLSDQCPPRFEKMADNTCHFRSLYDFYESPKNHGGVQAELPKIRSVYSPQQMDLGRYLFFDPLLSGNQDMSCATCHQPDKGFADGRGQGLGKRLASGQRVQLSRAAPTLWNVAFLQRYMADGRAATLEEQALMPLISPDEMANTAEQLQASMRASASYQRLFHEVFGEEPNLTNIAEALAAFQISLMSFDSRYDRYAHGQKNAMSEQEIRGYNHFRGFVGRCSQCHVPPLFTDSELAVIGSPSLPGQAADKGAGALSDDPFLMGAFRVPTLRNITRSAPYFHAGQFKKLDEVVHFYNDTRGHAAPSDLELKIHWHIHMTNGPKLSAQDEKDIVAFLQTLEDETLTPVIPESVPSGLPVTIEMEKYSDE